MVIELMLAAVVLGAPHQEVEDTVFRVDRGARLEVASHSGEVVVRTWDRSEVRVVAELPDRQRLDVQPSGSVIRVRPDGRGGPHSGDFAITIPRWMDLRVQGNQLDVSVAGSDAQVSIESIGGDLEVTGGRGLVSARTIQGDVVIRGTRGRVEAYSVNEDVRLIDVEGDVYVESTNGDIALDGLRSTSVRATTVNGDVGYAGTIRDGGRYVFATHNGDLTVSVPRDVNATVSVSTYHGEFESDFPVRLTGASRDRMFDFTLGSGSARIELESFNGEIRLRRP